MRAVDAKRLANAIEEFCNESESYGLNDITISNKEAIDNNLKKLDTKKLKKWFNNISVIGLFIDKLLFKSANYLVYSNDLLTFGGANIQSSSIPEAFKIKLSNQDKEALFELHQSIRDRSKEIKSMIYENGNELSMAASDFYTLSHYAVDISLSVHKICNQHRL